MGVTKERNVFKRKKIDDKQTVRDWFGVIGYAETQVKYAMLDNNHVKALVEIKRLKKQVEDLESWILGEK